jgi:hypothetical protein
MLLNTRGSNVIFLRFNIGLSSSLYLSAAYTTAAAAAAAAATTTCRAVGRVTGL